MIGLASLFCLLAQAGSEPNVADHLRENYHADAAKYVFQQSAEGKPLLEFVEKPIMRWANDNDWSGDVFVWTHQGRPEVVGCMLSGPGGETSRNVFHEFHLLAERPLAPVELHTKRRWQPKEGIVTMPVKGAPEPSKSAKVRSTQMRQIARDFTAMMEADGKWELRLLTQPLYRYGDEVTSVVDGALFAYVWTKGTDPELLLMLECRQSDDKLAWHYAPVRFSTRQVWLQHDGQEVWRAESHREPAGIVTDLPYTTAFARTMPKEPPPGE